MGHYRSEMGYEDEDARRERMRKQTLQATTEHLQKRIDEEGVAAVLAEAIVDDWTYFKIRNRK